MKHQILTTLATGVVFGALFEACTTTEPVTTQDAVTIDALVLMNGVVGRLVGLVLI